MTKHHFLLALLILFGIQGCITQKNKQMKTYQIIKSLSIQPHHSINAKEFKIQYEENTELWDKCFQFINENDLEKMAPGKYPISGERCFAVVSEYETKAPVKTKIESHKKYIDLQYIIKGKEQIGVTSALYATVKEPYVASRDVVFYQADQLHYHQAKPSEFFLFFPADFHQPGVWLDAATHVKKLVIKIENHEH
ncbi:YhcH/YjgK/YiaL family protein [Pedobacter sp. PLR]|uniref:YhcH/YjgK/YiaL family protein n=1 Tax=Pedobacter sp. PLR TaxID=2994465 RepID=UPI002245B998|nr:YhcH/YjgK/YiaL family protein [Pedobacter sp. PLR]MCX2450103.1 YhcH/YjgK/YiaL family protein [Pedobacter sp. PLR]